MSVGFLNPAENSSFRLGMPITFTGTASGEVVKVILFADRFQLGSDEVESGNWALTYPGFNTAGRRLIRVIGLDRNDAQVSSRTRTIFLSNMSPNGFEPGLDVSDFDATVNWARVKSAGYSFAFTKATEGGTFRASTFPRNWRLMEQSGIIRGAYHFFRPTTDPERQARNFLDYINDVDPIQEDDLPPALDLESFPNSVRRQWESLDRAERVRRVQTWIDVIEDKIKRRPIIYTSFGFWNEFMAGVTEFSSYPLWVANYTTRRRPTLPREWSNWVFWQFTDTAEIPGIPTPDEDGDRFNGSLSDLVQFVSTTIIS